MICTFCLSSTSTIYGPCNVEDVPFRACTACTFQERQCRIDPTSSLSVQTQQEPGSGNAKCDECSRRCRRCDNAEPRCFTCEIEGRRCTYFENERNPHPSSKQIPSKQWKGVGLPDDEGQEGEEKNLTPLNDFFSRASSATTNAFSSVQTNPYISPATSFEQTPPLSGDVDGRSFAADYGFVPKTIPSAGATPYYSAEESSQQLSTELSYFERPLTRPWENEQSTRVTSQLIGQPETVPSSRSYDHLFTLMSLPRLPNSDIDGPSFNEHQFTPIKSNSSLYTIVSGSQRNSELESGLRSLGSGPPATTTIQPGHTSDTIAPSYAPEVGGPASSAAKQDPLNSGMDMNLRTYLSTKFIAVKPDLATYKSWECSIADCPDAQNGRIKMTLDQMNDHARTHHVGFSLVHSQRLLHDAGCGLTLSHWIRLWHDYMKFKDTYGDIETIWDRVRAEQVHRGYRSWWSCREMYTRDLLNQTRNRIQEEKMAAALIGAREEAAPEREAALSTAPQISQDFQRLERQKVSARLEGSVMKIAVKKRKTDDAEDPVIKRRTDEAEVPAKKRKTNVAEARDVEQRMFGSLSTTDSPRRRGGGGGSS